jgi:hypothetical protein
MFKIFRTRKALLKQMAEVEAKVIERERKSALNERLALISEYENRIISESEKAAMEREITMLDIVNQKNDRIQSLELELSRLRSSYRNFKSDIQKHELLVDKTRNQLAVAKTTIAQLYGIFEGIGQDIEIAAERVEKKDRKLVERGEV